MQSSCKQHVLAGPADHNQSSYHQCNLSDRFTRRARLHLAPRLWAWLGSVHMLPEASQRSWRMETTGGDRCRERAHAAFSPCSVQPRWGMVQPGSTPVCYVQGSLTLHSWRGRFKPLRQLATREAHAQQHAPCPLCYNPQCAAPDWYIVLNAIGECALHVEWMQ
jgi:hypothetical protein